MAYFNKLVKKFRELGLTAEINIDGKIRTFQVDDILLLGKDMNEKVSLLKFILNCWKLEKALDFTQVTPLNVLVGTSLSKVNTYFKELDGMINSLFLDKDMIGSVDVSIEKAMMILDNIRLANDTYEKKISGVKKY